MQRSTIEGRAAGPPLARVRGRRVRVRLRVPATVWLGLLALVVAFAYSLLWNRILGVSYSVRGSLEPHYAFRTPGDSWCTFSVAGYVANGALGNLYEGCAAFLALPLFPILLAPLYGLGDLLGLTGPPVPTPTMWLLLAPAGLVVVFPLLAAVRGVLPPGQGALRVQLGAVLLVFVPAAMYYGHFEDVLAAALLLFALRLRRDGRWLYFALCAGGAVSSKQWALLAVPLLVPGIPRGQWRTALLGSAFVPFLLGALPLAVDWAHASKALLDPPTWPAYGHPSLWVDAGADQLTTALPRAVLLAGTVLLALRLRARPGLTPLLAAAGIAFLARCFIEPVTHPYYACPGLLFLLLHEHRTEGTVRRTTAVGLTLMAWGGWHGEPAVWWGAAALLAVIAAAPAARTLLGPAPAGDGPRDGPRDEPRDGPRDESEVQVEVPPGDSTWDIDREVDRRWTPAVRRAEQGSGASASSRS